MKPLAYVTGKSFYLGNDEHLHCVRLVADELGRRKVASASGATRNEAMRKIRKLAKDHGYDIIPKRDRRRVYY